MISFIFISTFHNSVFAADPKLISTINNAFEKIEGYTRHFFEIEWKDNNFNEILEKVNEIK